MRQNNKGFTLLELLVAMTVATVILTISLQIFESGVKIKNQQIDTRDVENNLRISMDYIRDDITEAGSFLGDQGYFSYYNNSGTEPKHQFCVDFDSSSKPDYGNLQTAWTSRFPGWTIDYSGDMIEIWYADAVAYSTIRNGFSTGPALQNFEIMDNPVNLGLQRGDYILLCDSASDSTDDAVRGSSSANSWVTVLSGVIEYTGQNTRGLLQFDLSLPFTDHYQTPYGATIQSAKHQFSPPDRVYLVHRIVYGVISKYVSDGASSHMYKMLIRDDFRDPTGSSRCNPQVVSTDIDGLMFTTVFKVPLTEDGTVAENWYNSTRLGYHSNYNGKLFNTTLDNELDPTLNPTPDAKNADLSDHDPRDLRSIIVDVSGVTSKKILDYSGDPGAAPKIYFKPDMGVVKYSTGGQDIRYPGYPSPDFFKHYRLSTNVGLRAVRLKDFAVNPND